MALLIWRQQRNAIFFYGGLLILWCLFLVILGNQMHAAAVNYVQQGCTAESGTEACFNLQAAYYARFGRLLSMIPLVLQLTPIFVGMLIGAPLIAREFEQRTHLFVWAQSVTRRRWAISIITTIMILYLLAAAVYTAFFVWCIDQGYPVDVHGGLQGNPYIQYDLIGIAPLGYIAFALAVGIAAGAIFRHTTLAAGIALFSYAILRFVVAHFRYSWVPATTYFYLDYGGPAPSWVTDGLWVTTGYATTKGVPVSMDTVNAACATSDNLTSCLQAHGWQNFTQVIPPSDFWLIQGVETTFFLIVALGLILFTVRYLVRNGE